jgi:hypothetical protein
VDDNYQKQLEEFDRIKTWTADIISKNVKKLDVMKNWKREIRTKLVKVRNDFVGWIDNFTNQFIR